MMPNLRNALLYPLLVAACAGIAFCTQHSSATIKSKPALPIVVNTWPFVNATRVAYRTLTQKPDASAIDAVEQGCSECERERCDGSVGWGGSPNEEGETTLDAMIMDGDTMDVGAVGCLNGVRDAISAARLVMEKTYHTLIVGRDATTFALQNGLSAQSTSSVESSSIWATWFAAGKVPNYRRSASASARESAHLHPDRGHDTIGMIAIHANGSISCGTTTNGASHKVPGRVGDSPIVGSGAYCESSVGGAAATGDGDFMMRFSPAFAAVNLMRNGASPTSACAQALAPIGRYYPHVQAAMVCVDLFGNHGAARIGFTAFPYSVYSVGMQDVQVVTV